ncbi:MAG: DUF6754 domain-containing protein [Anaerolineae bacterium]
MPQLEVELGLAIAAAFVLILLLLRARIRGGQPPELRRVRAFAHLEELVDEALETGESLHLALGTGGIGGAATSDALAGLTALAYLAERSVGTDLRILVTLADPTLLPAAQDAVRHGDPTRYDPDRIRWIAPTPSAYAAGVAGVLDREPLGANVMIGGFGDEFLLISENGARRGLIQVGGASSPEVLPFVEASVDYPLWGEEIYAGGAYLARIPDHQASLVAQDWLRTAVIAAIVTGVVISTLT